MYSAASIPRDLPAPSVMIRNWSSGRRGEGEGGGVGVMIRLEERQPDVMQGPVNLLLKPLPLKCQVMQVRQGTIV